MVNKKQNKQSYWDKRAIKAEKHVNDGAKRTEDVVVRSYRQAQLYLTNKVKSLFSRATARSGMTEEDLSILLNRQTPLAEIVELSKLAKDISNLEIKTQAQKRLNALSFKERITRAEDLKAKSYLVSKQVADVQLNTATDFYIDTIHDSYKDTVAESYIRKLEQQGVTLEVWNKKAFEKSGYQFKELSTKYAQNILDSHWHGSNYSKRIWNDTEALSKRLEELFTVESMTGMSEREMTKLIAKEFDRSIGVARRLIRTEANYMANQAKLKGWQDSGVKEYRLVAVLDLRTSKICQSKDGKIHLVSEAIVNGTDGNYPPFHPWCRTIAIAYFGERSVKGNVKVNDPISGDTFTLPRSATYDDWMNKLKEKYSSEEIDRQKIKIRNATSDNRSYRQLKELLGKENSPKSLEEYQDIKYNDGDEWNALKVAYRDKKLQSRILNGEYNLVVHDGKQGKHILDHNNYIDGRSYLLESIDPQTLVNEYAGTGRIERSLTGKWNNKELIIQDEFIGVNSNLTGELPFTNKFVIHYSKNGTHIVPTLKGEDRT